MAPQGDETGRILAEIPVALPRPRARGNPAYAALVASLPDLLEQEPEDE